MQPQPSSRTIDVVTLPSRRVCRSLSRWVLSAFVLAQLSPWAQAADIRSVRVQFPKGASSTTVTGRIRGDQTIDYLVGARQGQVANISLGTRHSATYFNILAPGEKEAAFFIGSNAGNQFEGPLPADGTYRIRVYMVRAAARRGETADYRLEIAIAAGAPAPAARPIPSTDAKVPGTNFHATGQVPCVMAAGQPMGSCAFGVTREGGGNAMVTVTRPDGRKRVIFFQAGRATGYDQSQSDRGAFKVERSGDISRVHIGDERYEIVDAVPSGG